MSVISRRPQPFQAPRVRVILRENRAKESRRAEKKGKQVKQTNKKRTQKKEKQSGKSEVGRSLKLTVKGQYALQSVRYQTI